MLIDSLIERLFAAQPKYKIEAYLRHIRDEHSLTSRQLRTTGTAEDLQSALREALTADYITVADLARYVDDVEENGNQHIFLFDLTKEGGDELSLERARRHRIKMHSLTENAYAPLPTDTITARVDRYNRLLIKQVYTASFWQRNEGESQYTEEREIIVRDRVKRRALNLLVINQERGTAEIRIERVEGPYDSDEKSIDRLTEFLSRLAPFLDVERHLTPTPIWDAFYAIATDRNEVRVAWDRGSEATATQTMSNRLSRTHTDIRDHADYRLNDPKWARREVRPIWQRGGGTDLEEIKTRLAEVKFDTGTIGKVEVFQTIDPDALNYVIGRIRHHTTQASN